MYTRFPNSRIGPYGRGGSPVLDEMCLYYSALRGNDVAIVAFSPQLSKFIADVKLPQEIFPELPYENWADWMGGYLFIFSFSWQNEI
jgi:hypothetical protein